ncbi:efflux RND transporter periplasmic adaptor subunit [Pseudothauera rhizosphaerae]|uniref:efflux RND transporter periplasmic adaptor subunit n=1 Tax=Pseudothauera rhizosphaerae TaxID=2565932 RepID=UPI001E31F347|nr:efflux RND transporter periplasmic adaptor subunit [Pseudothauera rhizosphaerae]
MSRPKGRSAGRWGIAIGVTGLFALALWWAFFRTVETIETVPVRRADIENAVTALGVLQPQRYVDVGAQVSGQIERIAVKPGDPVKQGDLLVEIDPALQQATVRTNRATLASLRAQLAEQEAQRDFASQQAERQQRLLAEDATTREEVLSALTALRVTEARIASLGAQIEGAQSTLEGNEALLGYTRIYAPMDGTVVTLDAREGQTLNATYQTPNLLRIADLSRMTVWTEVSEADVGRIRPGMPAYFTTLGLQDERGEPRRWQGTLRQVLPAPPAQGGTSNAQNTVPAGKVVLYTALFDVDNADGALMPQMSAQVFFVQASARNVLAAPLAALQPVAGQADLFTTGILADGDVLERRVRIGVRDRLYGEILDGLAEGEVLVTGIQRTRASRRLRW